MPADAGWTPKADLECADDEVPCRGACLREVGDIANTCELLLGKDENLEQLERSGDYLVANSLWGERVVRISLDDFEVTVLAEVPSQAHGLFVADGFAFYRGAGGLHRVPVAGGEPSVVGDAPPGLKGPARYTVADGYVYMFGSDTDAVTRVPVAGGEPEVVIDEPGIPWFAVTSDHYVYVGDLPDQGPYRVRRDDPSRRELVDLTDERKEFGVYASLHTWEADPGHVYALSGAGYARIDAESGEVERLIATDLFYLWPTQTSEHLAVFFGTVDQGFQLRSADWKTGHVEVIDQEPFDGIAEDDEFHYVTRDGALVRFPK